MKEYRITISLLLIFLIISNAIGQNNSILKFDNNGEFKIIQLTDLHWSQESPKALETAGLIKHIISVEKPDLAILTGDVVTAPPAKIGWLTIAGIFEEAKIPWTAILGNHDTEADILGSEIFELLSDLPYFVGELGPNISGAGNFTLPILNADETKTAAALYCIDSHNKPEMYKYGHYNWIQFDQIEWYRKKSKEYTIENNHKPIPALAFFHIPLIEYKNVQSKEATVGNKSEGVSSSDINSGMLPSFIDMKDVMGVFVGHDHNNDFIGIEHDIALAFGRSTGFDAYGKLERGARVIKLYENDFRFDTWITTLKGTEFKYYFPSGISHEDEATMTYLPALKNAAKGNHGLKYNYYEGGSLRKTADIETNAVKKKSGYVNNFTIESALVQDSFAFVFEGLIDIPHRGVYNFYTFSDDGSVLKINDEMVVDNDGSHSLRRRDGKVALEEGLHKIEVIYFENYMGEFLEVGWSGKSIREETIPDHVLYINE